MALVSKTSQKGAKARFSETGKGGKSVKVVPGKGGVNIGTPKHCAAKRGHSNVTTSY